MTCDRCSRVLVDACVGETFCASMDLSDEEACRRAADICLAWWENRDSKVEIDDTIWKLSEHRIDELACYPFMARAYLADMDWD